MSRLVYVEVDTLGAGRVPGVFFARSRAEAMAAANPQYYTMTETRLNERSYRALSRAQSDEIRAALDKATRS
jgi:hypothetical protein